LPFAICHLPFAICHLPFAICHLPFAICHLPFAICRTYTCLSHHKCEHHNKCFKGFTFGRMQNPPFCSFIIQCRSQFFLFVPPIQSGRLTIFLLTAPSRKRRKTKTAEEVKTGKKESQIRAMTLAKR
jgi:hypothetical protein